MRVKAIHKIPFEGTLYNLEVEDNHNYYADGVLVKNCHSAKSYSIQQLGKKCFASDFRIGFTGTLHKEKADNWNIESVLGPKIFEIGSKELIDRDILSKIAIVNVLLKYSESQIIPVKRLNDEIKAVNRQIRYLQKSNKDNSDQIDILKTRRTSLKKSLFKQEQEIVTTFEDRNKVFDWIFDKIGDGENSLVLVQKLDHLHAIEKYLLDNLDDKYQIFTIHGKIKTEQREVIRQTIQKEKNLIVVATYGCMSTGVNAPNLHNVILASPVKSEITIPQTIGRGLRKFEGKTKVVVWDIVDDMRILGPKNYMFKQFIERLKLYSSSGFKYFSKKLIIKK